MEKPHLGSCSKLCDVDELKFSHLQRRRKLRFVDGLGSTDNAFTKSLAAPMALESLRVHRSRLTDAGLTSIANYHWRLKEWCIDGCLRITADGLASLLWRQPHLNVLEIESLIQLKAAFLGEFENTTRIAQNRCKPQTQSCSRRIQTTEAPGRRSIVTCLRKVESCGTKCSPRLLLHWKAP